MTTPATTATTATADQIAAAAAAEVRLQSLLAMGDVNQANSVTGIHGDSGTGKSTLAATASEYAWQRFHRISRYYSADPGGFGNKLIRLIRLGIAQVYNPTNHIEPFETMENISKGWWPETILDPFTGYAAPDVKLIPPQRVEWVVYCADGHLVKRTGTKKTLNGFSLQCPTCKKVTTPQNWSKVEEVMLRAPGVEHVGLYVFDSGTSLSDWAMEDMAARAAANDPGVKDGNALSQTGARIVSGAYAFGANTQQHYGFAQNSVRRWIKNTRLIPGQVVPPIWTFLVQRATDDNTNVAVFGPKIAGNAKTPEVPSWMGNCLHTEIGVDDKGNRKHRLWMVNHNAPGTNIPYLAKTRAEPGDLPLYLEDGADEPIFTRFSLAYFFDQLEQALNKHAAQDAIDFPDAPSFVPLPVNEDSVVSTKNLNEAGLAGLGGAVVGRAQVTRPTAGVAAPAVARPSAVVAPVAKPTVAPMAAPKVATTAVTAAPAPAVTAAPAAAVAAVVAAPPAGRPPTPPVVRPRTAAPPPAGAPRPTAPQK